MTTDRGKTAITDQNGQYRIDGLSGHVRTRLSKPDFEIVSMLEAIMDRDRVTDLVVQRTIRIAPGERTAITLFQDDLDYDLAYAACSAPCKMIRTAGPEGTLISIRARARDENRSVCLLVDGGPPHLANPTCSVAEVTATTTLFYGDGAFQFYVKFGDGYREGAQSVEVSVTLGTQP